VGSGSVGCGRITVKKAGAKMPFQNPSRAAGRLCNFFFRIEAIPISIAPTEIPEVLHKREHRGTRGEATEVEAAETPNLIQESRLNMASEIDSAVITEPPK